VWNSENVDEILCIGNALFKRSVGKFKNSSSMKPNDLCPTFFVHDNKITLHIGNSQTSGDCADILQIQVTIDAVLRRHKACVVNHCYKCFACWKVDHVYYLFNAHDSDHNGSPAPKYKGNVKLSFILKNAFLSL
jgi:hypothetical protein